MSDERHGVPSASQMHRVAACPASFKMEQAMPRGDDSPEAASGTRIHAVLAGEADDSTLNADEAKTVEMCREQLTRVHVEWSQTAVNMLSQQIHTEKRLGLTVLGTVLDVTPESKGKFVVTGKGDIVYVEEGRALVCDYKSGRADIADAVDNHQLCTLACLVALRYNVHEVRVVIIAPWIGKPTIADYSEHAISLGILWIHETLENAKEATPNEATAGEHCRYCRAKTVCVAFKDAAHEEVQRLRTIEVVSMPDPNAALFARAMELSAEQLAAAMRGLKMVEWYAAAIKGAARLRAEQDPEFQRFYTLKEKKGRRSIEDVGAVFARANAEGVTPEAFTAECSIPLGSVKDLLKTATGKKGKELDAINDAVLGDAVKFGAPTKELVAVQAIEDESALQEL